MRYHQRIVSAVAAVLVSIAPASAEAEPDGEFDGIGSDAASVPATWILIDVRNHASGTSRMAAVLLGVARERGRSRQASLRVDCVDRRTSVHIDTMALHLGSSSVAVSYSLDGGPFRRASWQAGADGDGLELVADNAIAFLAELYGKTELRLAIVRPLSIPLLFTFAVGGAERSLGTMADWCRWSAVPALSEAVR